MFLTAGLASAKYFLKHVSRQNTLTQARRNISRHYDLVCSLYLLISTNLFPRCFGFIYSIVFNLQSNELFGFFLDDTMTYSAAVFKVAMKKTSMDLLSFFSVSLLLYYDFDSNLPTLLCV